MLEVPEDLKDPLVFMCASPAAFHNFIIIANRCKLNDQVQTNGIVITTALSFITVNNFMYLLL
ncbi:hypothetical protein [Fluviispira vulneris]|uniref:hypothetical protein n=1 Tax=Fluviispira vulneris TaxID=2763012 RepID=UPI0036F3F2AC